MTCPRCFQDIPANATYCLHCGAHIDSTLVAPRATQKTSKNNVLLPVAIVVSVLILAIGVVAGAVILTNSGQFPASQTTRGANNNAAMSNANTPVQRINHAPVAQTQALPQQPSQSVQPPPQSAPQSNRVTLLSQVFEVRPGQYYTTTFTVPESGARIVGRFQAVSGDNIQVHIVDADNYANFQHRNPFRSYYSSGKSYSGDIDVRLAPATYYLVFENLYSILSKKVVQANVSMEY
jgi:hypothetical protein